MAYVVTAPCFGCKYTDCVVVCPKDCFHEGEKMLYIDPEECIDCGACEPECPVEAIFDEAQLPDSQREWVKVNQERANKLPVARNDAAAMQLRWARRHGLEAPWRGSACSGLAGIASKRSFETIV